MKKLLLILLVFVGVQCTSPTSHVDEDNYTLSIDGRLDTTSQGLYKLTLNPTQNSIQTIHRISGELLNNNVEPERPQLVSWESSHEWILTDTAYSVIRRTINVNGVWVVVDTIDVVGFDGETVPTINTTSYSGTDGEINTVIAPVTSMRDDTMIVRAIFKDLTETIKIILK